jgi:hypothetical protein
LSRNKALEEAMRTFISIRRRRRMNRASESLTRGEHNRTGAG